MGRRWPPRCCEKKKFENCATFVLLADWFTRIRISTAGTPFFVGCFLPSFSFLVGVCVVVVVVVVVVRLIVTVGLLVSFSSPVSRFLCV